MIKSLLLLLISQPSLTTAQEYLKKFLLHQQAESFELLFKRNPERVAAIA